MKNVHSGSALLLVLFITSGMVLSITMLWRSLLHMSDCALVRQQVEQRMRSAHTYMRAVIALSKQVYPDLYQQLSHEECSVMTCDAWPLSNSAVCQAYAWAKREDNSILLRTELSQEGHIFYTMSCCLCMNDDQSGDEHTAQRYLIKEWHEAAG